MKKKLLIITSIGVIIDILLKLLATKYLLNNPLRVIPGFFSLTYVQNYGAAFSVLQGKTIVLVLIALFTLIYLYIMIRKNKLNKLETIGYSLFLAGIIGNLIDRICYGYVIDFLHFYIGNNSFPIFNFADICITVGAGLLLLNIIKENKNENISR